MRLSSTAPSTITYSASSGLPASSITLSGGNFTSCAMAPIRASCSGVRLRQQLDAFERNHLFDDVQFRPCHDVLAAIVTQPAPLRPSAHFRHLFLGLLGRLMRSPAPGCAASAPRRPPSRMPPATDRASGSVANRVLGGAHLDAEQFAAVLGQVLRRIQQRQQNRLRFRSSVLSRNSRAAVASSCSGGTRRDTPNKFPWADTAGRAAGTAAPACPSAVLRWCGPAAAPPSAPVLRSRKGQRGAQLVVVAGLLRSAR